MARSGAAPYAEPVDGPPPSLAVATGLATFTPCGDRRWRVAIDGTHVGVLAEDFQEGDTAWVVEAGDGRVCPRRESWMSALTDLPSGRIDQG